MMRNVDTAVPRWCRCVSMGTTNELDACNPVRQHAGFLFCHVMYGVIAHYVS